MATNTTMLTGGVTTTVQQDITVTDLMPNNYLTIVWGDTSLSTVMKDLNIDAEKQAEIEQNLQNALTQSINQGKIGDKTSSSLKNKYINVTGVAKYLAQNTIPAGPKRVAVNALITMAGGGKNVVNEKVTNTVVNVFGSIANKTAHDLGYSNPHEVFAGVASENTIQFFKVLGQNAQQKINDKIRDIRGLPKTSITSKDSKESGKKYIGLVVGLTNSDTESYEVTIPRRKVENGSDYTTHLLPQPFKKEFSGTLTNKLLTSKYDARLELESIEYVKNKLIEIAKSHTTFDIYIRLSNDKMYKRTNVVFSSLSFTKDESTGSGYSFSFTVEPIEEFKTQTFVSDRKYFPTGNKSSSGGTGGSRIGRTSGTGSGTGKGGGKPNPKADNSGKPITVNRLHRLGLNLNYDYRKFKNLQEAQNWIHSLNSDPYFKGRGFVMLQHSDDKNIFDIYPANSIINGVKDFDNKVVGDPTGAHTRLPDGSWKGSFFYPKGSKVGYRVIK